MKEKATDSLPALDFFADECKGCKLCYAECSVLNGLGMSPVQLARLVAGDQDVPENIISLVQQCSLCGLCSSHCPFALNPGDLMQTARQSLIASDAVTADTYLPMLVDQEHHFFSLFRNTWKIDYSDLKQEHCSTLFFPGCSLSSFSPELTRSVYGWLQQQDSTIGFSAACCGLPLANIGLAERCCNHVAKLGQEFSAAGVKRIISACPNCFYHLQGQFPGVEVVSLYPLLVDAGFQLPAGLKTTIHDSCPDRYTGLVGEAMRSMLASTELTEMEHHGKQTICCGSGGIVSMVAPEVSQQRAELRIDEIRATKADLCVSTCMACVKRLHGEEDDSPEVVHLLELVFDHKLDHVQLQQRLEGMWQGEPGQRNLELLSGGGEIANARDERTEKA